MLARFVSHMQLENKLSSLRLTEDLSFTTHLFFRWALKVPKRATRFFDMVRNYLQEKFDVVNAIGRKADPVQVSSRIDFNSERLKWCEAFYLTLLDRDFIVIWST